MEEYDSFSATFCFVFSIKLMTWIKAAKKPEVHVVKNPVTNFPKKVGDILANCPSLKSVYYPSFFFLNAHLQLIAFVVNCYLQEYFFQPYNWVTEVATLSDNEKIALDWVEAVPCDDPEDTTPIIMFHHGAGGRSTDLPGQSYIREALARGWHVCALNRRGHKPGIPLSRERWNFFGSTEDLRYVIQELVKKKRPKCRLLMLGISAGSGLVALYMGEQGDLQRRLKMTDGQNSNGLDVSASFCDAAIGICPGFDAKTCMGNFSAPYSWAVLNSQKEFLKRHEHVVGHKESFRKALEAPDLQTWLDSMWGFAHDDYSCSEDYYANHNPMNVIKYIHEPCLFINTEDDPVCVKKNVDNAIAEGLLRNDMNAALAITKTGSHCCFFEFASMPIRTGNWAERVCFEYFDAALAMKAGL